MQPTIYLFFKGNCREAMTHYAKTLGGTVAGVVRNADVADQGCRMPGGDDMVMHMAVRLDDATIMASDSPAEMYRKPEGFSVSLQMASLAEFDRVHAALAERAEAVMMPPGETFFAERFAMFTDRFGTPWMLNFAGAKQAAQQGSAA
ncbi:MAG: VOC family protein [Alphaproteobacteria bacterium]